jgi:dynein heavy chain
LNFANELRAILREVKYLQLIDFPIPASAQKLFAKVETYRVQTIRLQIIVDMYNNILATLLPVEKPLLAKKIDAMGKALEPGVATLKWNSDGIDKFIKNAHETVEECDGLVKKMKENVQNMYREMERWKSPLFERK